MFQPQDYPDMLVGLGEPDDAAVWRLDDARALVVTTDFFTPVVDDAYDYGSIAAANALSDLYAMGATPIMALNIAGFPPSLPADVTADILLGGAEKVREAGAAISGGHTIQDEEPKYGLVALGLVALDELMTKTAARAGDVLMLSKPLGTGVITTALKREIANSDHVSSAVAWMKRLSAPASRLARQHGVRAATDVTGFGLLGHSQELAEASSVHLRLWLRSIPFMAGADEYARAGAWPGGSADNMQFFTPAVAFEEPINEIAKMLLFDAQTSGGMLLAVPEGRVGDLLADADILGIPLWAIGRVESGSGIAVVDAELEMGAERTPSTDVWFFPRA
jgi:selenide,water dikinase